MTAPRKKSDRLSWFKMDAGAFLADTTGLPAAHVGIYARLLNLYWALGGMLPDSPAILKRKINVSTSEEEQILEKVLEEFFPESRNEWLDNQLEEVDAKSRAQSEKAKGRWAPKQQKGTLATRSLSSDPDSADF